MSLLEDISEDQRSLGMLGLIVSKISWSFWMRFCTVGIIYRRRLFTDKLFGDKDSSRSKITRYARKLVTPLDDKLNDTVV